LRRSSSPLLVLLLALAMLGAVAMPSQAQGSPQAFLRAAEHGVGKAGLWWQKKRHWYGSRLGGRNVINLWGVVPLFEAVNGIALAQPSPRHIGAVNFMAQGAQRYFNPTLSPVPGFGPKPDQNDPYKTTWFDDNGWFGLAFLDAYKVTGNPQYLYDAELAQQFISVSGWDTTPGRPGGLWWNTNESFYAGESLAGGTLLSARLYEITHQQSYLADAQKFITWADQWLVDPATGLYARLRKPGTYPPPSPPPSGTAAARSEAADRAALAANPDEAAKLSAAERGESPRLRLLGNYPPFAPSPMPYVNGPMILAHRIICDSTGIQSYCARAEDLAQRATTAYQHFWMGPQFDFWFIREFLEFAQRDNNPVWLAFSSQIATKALKRTNDRHGLLLRTWYGKKASWAGSPKGSLQLHAANAALFAWMAALGH
jgi:hypothetical protein